MSSYFFSISRVVKQVLVVLALIVVSKNSLSSDEVTVVYPFAPQPYNAIFQSVVDGIGKEVDGNINKIQLKKGQDLTENGDEAKLLNDSAAVILLGKGTVSRVDKVLTNKNAAIGLVLNKPDNLVNNYSGISLIPSPISFSEQVASILPKSKKIHVVYSVKHSSYFMSEKYRGEMGRAKHEFMTYPVTDTQEAISQYNEIVGSMDNNDIIWLPLDPVTSNRNIILPKLLEDAWEKGLILLSSNPSHVNNGVLLSLHPNNEEMGRELARIVKNRSIPGSLYYLSSFKVMLNRITYRHLDITIDLDKVDQVFSP